MMIGSSDTLGGYLIGSQYRDRRKQMRLEKALSMPVRKKISYRQVKASLTDTYTPPADVARAAQQALDVRAEASPSNRGMTLVGLARARQLANRQPVSLETIQRMASYFARHEVDKQGSTWSEKGKGWQAWQGWGGDAGRAWAKEILQRVAREN